jgi:hypothetical protein
MTTAPTADSRLRSTLRFLYRSPTALWSAFILAHLLLGFQALNESGEPLGDVENFYHAWALQADQATYYVGIDRAWVYPILALFPMVLAGIFGFANYTGTWLGMVFVFDLIAFAVLVGWRRQSRPLAAAWWWIAFLVALGPIALGRIDTVSVSVAIVGVMFLAARPKIAAFVLTLATWIKVWPAALIAAVIIASRARIRVLVVAIVTSAVIVAACLALGAGANVFSFVTQQTSRALQVEAPISTIWMWMSFAHVGGSYPYFNVQLNTFEVLGPGSLQVAALLTPLLGLVVLVVVLLGIVAVQRGAVVTELLPVLALALVSGFIGFNKVGSPQYMTWLAVPIILGLATNSMGFGKPFRFPAVIGIAMALLTQMFYPVLYTELLTLNPVVLVILSVRNILVLVLFAWSVAVLVDLARPFRNHEVLADSDSWLPAVWPFELRPTRGASTTWNPHTKEDHDTP